MALNDWRIVVMGVSGCGKSSVGLALAGLGRLGDHSGCGKVGIQCAADVLFVGRQEQVGVQSLKVAVGVAPSGK